MSRHLAKTVSFAALHFAVGFTVSYVFTGSIAIASGIALVEPLANTVVFYWHERAWNGTRGHGFGHRCLAGLQRRARLNANPFRQRRSGIASAGGPGHLAGMHASRTSA